MIVLETAEKDGSVSTFGVRSLLALSVQRSARINLESLEEAKEEEKGV